MSNQEINDGEELWAVADLCLIPMGVADPSVGPQIAECQRVLEKSGVEYTMHGYGTNIEGPWSKVTKVIYDCHVAVHKLGTPRISSDIRIGTRVDRKITGGGNKGKKERVEQILAKDKEQSASA